MTTTPSRTSTTPKRGEQIPDFSAPTPDGDTLRWRDLYMRRNLALIFTAEPARAEARELLRGVARQHRAILAEASEALAVVKATPEAAGRLRDELDLPFPIVADPDGAFHARYGLTDEQGAFQPAIFITDRYGTVFEASLGGRDQPLMTAEEIPGWLEFVACRCS